jgi:hypothetical protein
MWPFRKKAAVTKDEAATRSIPHLILAGFGVHDRLQLTVETQRLLARYGKAYTIALPPGLRAFLKSLRVQIVDLDDRFAPGRHFGEAYLEVVGYLLERVALERPVILLSPGNPLLMNTVARTLVIEGRRLGLSVQTVAGVSPLDVIINDIGVDVGLFGLQVFDAHWLTAQGLEMTPSVPAIILNLAGFDLSTVPDSPPIAEYGPLIKHLRRFYDSSQEVTLIRTSPSGTGFTFGRARLGSVVSQPEALAASTCLFIDAVLPPTESEAGPAHD